MDQDVVRVLQKWDISEKGIQILTDEGITDFQILQLVKAKDLETKLTIRDRIYFQRGHAGLYPELYSDSIQQSTSKESIPSDSTPEISSTPLKPLTDDDNSTISDSTSIKSPAAGSKRQRKKNSPCFHSVDFLKNVLGQYQEGRLVLTKLALYEAQAEEQGQSLQTLITLAFDRSDYRSIAHCIVSYLADKARKENPSLDRYPNIKYNTFREFAVPCATLFGNKISSWFDVEAGQSSARAYAASSLSPRPGKKSNKNTQANGYLWFKYKHEVSKYNKEHREQLEQRKAHKRLITIENRETAAKKKAKRESENAENPRKSTRGRPAVQLKTAEELTKEAEGLWNAMVEDKFVKYLLSSWTDFSNILPEFITAFNNCHHVRCAYLHHDAAEVTKYLSTFPFYASPHAGPKLINEDFLAKYPYPETPLPIRHLGLRASNDASNIFAIVRKNCSNALPLPFNTIPNVGEIDDPYRAEHCLLVLVHAVGGTCYTKTAKGSTPVSKADAARTVIVFVQSAEQVEEHHNKVREQNLGIIQPYIIAIGSAGDIGNVSGIEVRLLDLSLPCESIIKAYELCFQCFYVFNLQYPLPAHNIWTFIQTRYFDIPLSANQKVRSNTQDLLTKLQHLDSSSGSSGFAPPSNDNSSFTTSLISETEILYVLQPFEYNLNADTEPVDEDVINATVNNSSSPNSSVNKEAAEKTNPSSCLSTGHLTPPLESYVDLEQHESHFFPNLPPKRRGVRTRGGKS